MNLRPLMFMALAGLTLPLCASDVTQINRYATVAHKPLPAQINPLKSVQQMHFPQNIQTIGEAVNYWLQHSGYHLAPTEKQPPSLKQILNAPLPQVDKTLGPLSIEAGLLVLVGQGDFELKAHSLKREVNFQLKGTTL